MRLDGQFTYSWLLGTWIPWLSVHYMILFVKYTCAILPYANYESKSLFFNIWKYTSPFKSLTYWWARLDWNWDYFRFLNFMTNLTSPGPFNNDISLAQVSKCVILNCCGLTHGNHRFHGGLHFSWSYLTFFFETVEGSVSLLFHLHIFFRSSLNGLSQHKMGSLAVRNTSPGSRASAIFNPWTRLTIDQRSTSGKSFGIWTPVGFWRCQSIWSSKVIIYIGNLPLIESSACVYSITGMNELV